MVLSIGVQLAVFQIVLVPRHDPPGCVRQRHDHRHYPPFEEKVHLIHS